MRLPPAATSAYAVVLQSYPQISRAPLARTAVVFDRCLMTKRFDQLGRDGVFSRAEALDWGETDKSLASARQAGLIVRLRRGMYAAAAIYHACDDSGKHLLHARAALLAQQGDAVLAGASAAAMHGFALHDQDLSMVHLLRTDTVRSHHAALHLDPALRERLEELAERFAYFPGSRRARLALKLADHRAESPGESVTRVQFNRHGIPIPELQHPVVDDRGEPVGRSDFYWEYARHIGEFDGEVKYLKYLRPGESPTKCVVREKRREDKMRSGRHGMSRFVWADVMPQQSRRTMQGLARALEESYRLYVRGRVIIAS